MLVPIHKSGDKTNPSNYRAIAISSCLSKLFTSILNKRLVSYLEINKLISQCQFGFRKNRRTSDCMFLLKTAVTKTVYASRKKKSGNFLYAAFIDFRKAFDSVWRKGLLFKLQNIGVTGNFYNIIKTMYEDVTYKVKLPSNLSQSFTTALQLLK